MTTAQDKRVEKVAREFRVVPVNISCRECCRINARTVLKREDVILARVEGVATMIRLMHITLPKEPVLAKTVNDGLLGLSNKLTALIKEARE